MERYQSLAQELFDICDAQRKSPPHEEVSASMRGEMAVMRLLALEDKQMTAGSISRLLDMTTSRIAAVLGSLEKKGFVERRIDEEDKRRVLVRLTESGRAMHAKRKEQLIAHMTQMLSDLGEEDAATFVRLIRRVQHMVPPPPPQG